MQRMQRKQEGDHCAGPSGRGGAIEKCEKEQGRDGVQQHVDEVMPSGVEAEELHVQHVRKTGQRKPVRGFGGRECPSDAVWSYALTDMSVVGDVIRIVKIDEVEGS